MWVCQYIASSFPVCVLEYMSSTVNIKVVCFSLCHQVIVLPLKKPGGGRRRQLVFTDPQVQISDRAMKEQIENPLAETVSLVEEHTGTTHL